MQQQPVPQCKSLSAEVYSQSRNRSHEDSPRLRRGGHTLTVPCSSRKRRERLAASISGVGLSRTCLHHCKGLRDFSGEVNVFEEPMYNLKKERNPHYRYDIDYRKCLSLEGKQHALNVPIETEPHLTLQSTDRIIFNRQISPNRIGHFPKPAENYFKNTSKNPPPLCCVRDASAN